MDITFVVCKDKSTQAVNTITKVLGPSKAVTYDIFDGKFESCSTVAILFSFVNGQMESDIQSFLHRYADQLKMKRVALLSVTENEPAVKAIFQNITENLGECIVWSGCVEVCGLENSQLLKETTAKLIEIKRKLKDAADMPSEIRKEEIDKFLLAHNTCTLCTGYGDHFRATPIEYVYFQNAFYFLSEGGEKFAYLFANARASIAVYDAYTGFNSLGGLQTEGIVQTVTLFSEEYASVVTQKGLNAANMQKLPVILHMFKVLPERFELLESAFSKNHYSAKQVLEL